MRTGGPRMLHLRMRCAPWRARTRASHLNHFRFRRLLRHTGPPGMVEGLRMSLKAPGLMTTMPAHKSSPATETKVDSSFGKAESGTRNGCGPLGTRCDSPSTVLHRGDYSKAKRRKMRRTEYET